MGQDTTPADSRQTELVEIETHLVPVDDIRPNDYNPNRMDDQEFSEFVAEVKHLGRLPKPVVIRPKVGLSSAAFCIVDGEHGWRAAKEVGFEKIPCEIVHVDDFEAMRQTYKRNQHGRPDQVLLGQMFQAMMDGHKFSRRQLADAIKVSDGTIRNALEYSEAVRNSYAPEAVAPLSIRQVRQLNELPRKFGRAWLNAGADPNLLARCIRNPKAMQTWEATGLLDMVSPILTEPEVKTLESWRETFTEWVHTVSEWATCEDILLSNDKTNTETIRKYTRHASGKHADWLSINDLSDIVATIIRPTGRMKLTPEQFKTCIEAASKEAWANLLREIVQNTLDKRHDAFLTKLAGAVKETSASTDTDIQAKPSAPAPVTCRNCGRAVQPDDDGDCPQCREPKIDQAEQAVGQSALPPAPEPRPCMFTDKMKDDLEELFGALDNARRWAMHESIFDTAEWKSNGQEIRTKIRAVWSAFSDLQRAAEDSGIFADEEADQ